ncbi:uncharacterized protein LOC115628347 isoform X2 [Scaptodrosophila lebanonensis]|uniref:Uncharacterized protein LOC115628347 isoform X2 n=1 Tax=Drosophila lebanonensis TaxID=7225 RepID=A0A6J2TXJ4_DROLE|nr:uncharacterized protein LOC115628347 isoform X2 [Scaptodrosophila lebanonensis]
MSDDTYQIETRRRSRSKTPFLRSGRDHENLEQVNEDGHVHQKKKKSSVAPNVQTIIEEHVTKTTSSSSSSSADKIRGKVSATARQHLTSDYSSDDTTPEDKRRQQQQQTKTTTVTSIITQTSKRLGNAFGSFSSASTSTPRNNSQIETTQNVLNSAQEQRSSSKRISRSNGGNVGNSELLPYHEYKEAGEYWNKTPKTDYTYSELSPDRRLLAPGIVAMPNMSRRGLENHNARVNLMVQQNPAQEEFIRRRYQSKYTQRQSHLNYDSADEVDITNFGANQQKQSWWFFRLITTVVTTITTVWARIANVGGSSETDIYHTYYGTKAQQAGILGKIRSGLLSILRYLYLFIASVLSLDTWLLKSSKPENKAKKRFLLLLLILLPLLLLTGLFYYLHPNESFPPQSFSEYTFTLPELPKISFNVNEYVNQAQYEAYKAQAIEQATRVRDWADDYVLYLRTIGQNVVDRGRSIFRANDEVYYERV